MSKHNWKQSRQESEEGADIPAEQEEQSAIPEEGAETPQSAENNEQSAMPVTMGIGMFVRYMLTKSSKSNAEILALVTERFEGAKTTMACIAWYKSDLRKKGVLPKTEGRSATKMVEITPEELENMVK